MNFRNKLLKRTDVRGSADVINVILTYIAVHVSLVIIGVRKLGHA